MAFSNSFSLILCSTVLLIACGDGSGDSVPMSVTVLPQENPSLSDAPTVLSAREQDVLSAIKQRSNDDGALYQFDTLNPIFEEAGDLLKVSFEYIDQNTIGGSPIAEYSLSQSEIISIVYTQ